MTVETLASEGLLRREIASEGRISLCLTDTGRDRARERYDRLATTEIERLAEAGRRECTLEAAAQQLDESVPAVAATCTEDGLLPRREIPEPDNLVDHADEYRTVEAVLDRCRTTGEGELVIVGGPSGIGKTGLVRTLLNDLGSDVDTLEAQCRAEAAGSYQAIRDLLADLDGEDPFTAASPVSIGPNTPAGKLADSYRTQQLALFQELTDQLTPGEDDEPSLRVLLFDDLHRADPATCSYLTHLCGRLAEEPVIVVGTHVIGEPDENSPVEGLSIPDSTPTTTVELDDLDRNQTARLIEQIVGHHGAPDAFVEAVYERTGGWPRFIEETVTALLENGELDPQFQWYPDKPAAIDLPEAVDKTVVQRMELLAETDREVLEWVAIAGDAVPVSVLQAVCDQSPVQVATTLDVLTEADILQRQGDGGAVSTGRVTQKALLETLDADSRRHKHGVLAQEFERHTTGEDERSVQPATIASHYEQAEDSESAIEWYRRAAERAGDVYANEVAVEHYHRILDIAERIDAEDALLSAGEQLAEVYMALGEHEEASRQVQFVRERLGEETGKRHLRVAQGAAQIATTQGEYDTAREKTRRQRKLARELDAREFEADALEQLGKIGFYQGEYDRARERYRQSIGVSQDIGDKHREAATLQSHGVATKIQGEYEWAQEIFQHSLDIAEEIDDRKLIADSHNSLGNVTWRQGEFERAKEYYQQSLASYRDLGNLLGEANVLNNIAVIARKQGEYELARESYEEVLDIDREFGNRHGEAISLYSLGEVALNRGRYERAREYFERSLELSQEFGIGRVEVVNHNRLGTVLRERGNTDRARERYETALEMAQNQDISREKATSLHGLGVLAGSEGNHKQARSSLDRALTLFDDLGDQSKIGRVRLDIARLALNRGDRETAREQATQALDCFEELDATHRLGRSRRLLGRVAVYDDARDEAEEHWRAALHCFEEVGAPQDTLATLGHLVETCRERGDDEQAREWCRQAQEMLSEAPDPVADLYRPCVERHSIALGLA